MSVICNQSKLDTFSVQHTSLLIEDIPSQQTFSRVRAQFHAKFVHKKCVSRRPLDVQQCVHQAGFALIEVVLMHASNSIFYSRIGSHGVVTASHLLCFWFFLSFLLNRFSCLIVQYQGPPFQKGDTNLAHWSSSPPLLSVAPQMFAPPALSKVQRRMIYGL